MSKPAAFRGWVCAFCTVALIATASFVVYPGRHGRTSVAAPVASSESLSQAVTTSQRSRIQAAYAALPLAFEQNQGQSDSQVKYLARGNGYTLFLTANDAVFSLHSRLSARTSSAAVVRMHLLGANASAKVEGIDAMPGRANYFLGNDPAKWHTDVTRFARVSYQNVYPGVNMAFHGAQRQTEFDFVVAPGADPTPIGFQVMGNRGMKTDKDGNLIIASTAGDVVLHKPVAYQEEHGTRQPVDSRFVLARNRVNLKLGNYDRSRELVIDPSVSYAYSTYLGGSGTDNGIGIAVDGGGNAYVTGETSSTNFPGVSNALRGTQDAFVTKIASDGSTLVYSTYIGGSGVDSGNGIAVDSSGEAFVAGGTQSPDFPATSGAFQTALKTGAVGSAVVFELSADGSKLKYSTYLGGSVDDVALGIALDGSGKVYVAGGTASIDFPTSVNTLQIYISGSNNGFVTKLDPSVTGAGQLAFSTYLGPGGGTGGGAKAVAVDSSGNIYVTGATSSPNFHTGSVTGSVYQSTCGSCTATPAQFDAFITVINPAGNGGNGSYVYSTFLGGIGSDIGFGIAVDSSGNAYVTGSTTTATSVAGFPASVGAKQAVYGGGTADAFVTKLNPAGNGVSDLIYSTYLGGSGFDAGAGIAVDKNGNAYITGSTASAIFPTTVGATQASYGGNTDAFVSELNTAGSQLLFSTYLGGSSGEDFPQGFGSIAVDPNGTFIYVTGNTDSATDFPHQSAHQSANGGGSDAFAVKYAQGPAFGMGATTPAAVSPGSSATSTITLTAYNGYNSAVNLACAVSGTGTPAPTCSASSFSPASPITPTSSGATTTLTISTTASHAANLAPRNFFYALWLPFAGTLLTGLSFPSIRSQRKKLLGLLMLGMIMSILILLPACGGGSGSGGCVSNCGGSGGTPAGAYSVTVTGTGTDAAAVTQSAEFTVTVN